MSKATGSPFGRPQRDFDPQAFLDGGVSSLRPAAERTEQVPVPAAPPVPVTEPAAPVASPPQAPSPSAVPRRSIESVGGRAAPRQVIQERRSTASYKHKEANHEKLRLLAHRLDRPMGELLDEALERMFPDWVAQLPAEPRF